jgi:hypothetical protein
MLSQGPTPRCISRCPAILVLAAALVASLALPFLTRAQETPRPGEMTLPLPDYLALIATGERVEKERAQRLANRVEPLAEVVTEKTWIVVVGGGDGEARVRTELEVLVQGAAKTTVPLPVSFVPDHSEARSVASGAAGAAPRAAPAALSAARGGLFLVAPQAGRYKVTIEGTSRLVQSGGAGRFRFSPVAAPVAVAEIELPADLVWRAPGAVVVDEKVEGGRRKVRLTARHGEAPVLEVRRKVDGGDGEKLLAQCVVLTLVKLGPEGAVRHDVVLYEVSRGSLASFAVDLPPGLNVEAVGTDEGGVVPVAEAQRLTVQRRNQLLRTGYLVLTSRPGDASGGGELTLAPVVPSVEVRARYLTVASTVAAEARPLPEADWSRVDLEDLPPDFRDALRALDPTAAWRLSGAGTGARLAVARLGSAPLLPAVVRRRDTTTVVTVDGTVLHRDVLTLQPVAGVAAALAMVLPPGATLWSAKVDDVPVRPLESAGKVTVPLGFNEGKGPVVEVISVLAKAIPGGRSQLGLELPQIAAPVQDHRWRLLLPPGPQYRFRGGDLEPVWAPTAPRRRGWRGRASYLTSRTEAPIAGADASASGVAGQGTANLYGTVVDEQGSALPGVTVTLQGSAMPPQVQVTDVQGRFRILQNMPGSYSLKAELEGFSTLEYPNVQMSSGRNTQVEVTLSTAVEDVITVTAESPLLDQRQMANTQTYDLNEGGGGGGGRHERKAKAPAAPPPPKPTDMAATAPAEPSNIGGNEGLPATAYADLDAFEEMKKDVESLKSGLVGGVRPLPVAIPENGKLLVMAGLLPPGKVSVELEVKAKK